MKPEALDEGVEGINTAKQHSLGRKQTQALLTLRIWYDKIFTTQQYDILYNLERGDWISNGKICFKFKSVKGEGI